MDYLDCTNCELSSLCLAHHKDHLTIQSKEREREFLLRKVELQKQAMRFRKEQQLMWLQPWNLRKQTMEKATMLITS
ncbi:hypothetical protein YC2023_110151 [Brassica napus]|uniref:(rape) hypothetical protein n=1 Tax=Brassica napus TaxID=3708 RepID=A0A816PBR0_BRANA|nr:unnamed protein product [Brassica napus]